MDIKKKKASKNKKSTWRKTNIDDVDKFLEFQREEERIGSLENVESNEFFHIDVSPNKNLLSRKERRRLKVEQQPKCYSMLQSHSKVPDPITKRNRVRTKEERMCPIVKRKLKERKLKGILTKTEQQSVKDRQRNEEVRSSLNSEAITDIWEDDDKDEDSKDWIGKQTKRHTLRGIGKLNKVIPRMKNTLKGVLPNVEIPHPGTSYNPSYEDHQRLLNEIAEKEIKLIKEEEHINRVTKGIFTKVTVEEKDSNWIKEMSEGIVNVKEENDVDTRKDKSGKPYDSVNPPVVNKKKTKQQRRKQKEQLLLKEQLKKAKIEKKKVADIHKLKFIADEIAKDEEHSKVKQEERMKLIKLKANEPKQLGKLKFEEPDVDVNMVEDISGNLRNLKTEGSLLKDRFNSLQRRNVIPVTIRHIRKKAKVKKFVKPGFNDWKVTTLKK